MGLLFKITPLHPEDWPAVWTLYSSLFPENEASMALHLQHGFRVIGRRERIAQRAGVWRD